MPRPSTRNAPTVLIDVPEAARRLSVSRRTIDRLMRTGHIPCVHIGRAVRIAEADLDDYIDSLRHDPFGGTS